MTRTRVPADAVRARCPHEAALSSRSRPTNAARARPSGQKHRGGREPFRCMPRRRADRQTVAYILSRDRGRRWIARAIRVTWISRCALR